MPHNYSGLEIEMLNVGKADCILVSRWSKGAVTRVLIDGGERHHARKIKALLRKRGALHIQHVVCSHLHKDHAAGLVELVKDRDITFDCAWVHLPEKHVDVALLQEALEATAGNKVSQFLTESLRTQKALVELLDEREIPIKEPFATGKIGFLTICGPRRAYYRNLLARFTDRKQLEMIEEQLAYREDGSVRSTARLIIDELLEEQFGLAAAPVTAPENDASTILGMSLGGETYLFTSDAGAEALTLAGNSYKLSGCAWMQIPHHGSRHNITQSLIDYFNPTIAFVSADGGRHPHASVIAAFKGGGAIVYGTHHPSPANLWHAVGNVPSRPEYSDAVPL
jgi:beta-lactamase superfamily II metal-dependent hydrolase